MPDSTINCEDKEVAEDSNTEPSHSPELELVQRIVKSRKFARSTLLANFLVYICDRKMRGLESEINEYQIGVNALGRSASFHTGEDNIVRNYAGILRKRLAEYFATEGRDEPLRIVVPRGHYVPIFETRQRKQILPLDSSLAASSTDAEDLQAVPQEVTRFKQRSFKRWFWVPLSVLLVAGTWFAIHTWSLAHNDDVYTLFWRELLTPGRTTFLVPGDTGLAVLQAVTDSQVKLYDYVIGNQDTWFPSADLTESTTKKVLDAHRLSNLTSTADLSIAIEINLIAQKYAPQEHIFTRYARDMRMEDLKGSNVILIGGPNANPWTALFEPELNFPMEIEELQSNTRWFINKHPSPGEQSKYSIGPRGEAPVTYTLIAFLPSLDGKGHSLLIQGLDTAGTQAAGDFLQDQTSMKPVLAKARLPNGSIGPFEVLLGTRIVGANAPNARVIAERLDFKQPLK